MLDRRSRPAEPELEIAERLDRPDAVEADAELLTQFDRRAQQAIPGLVNQRQLPTIRDWTERHFDFTGYVTGFDPADLGERTKSRAELGYGDDQRICIVTVGGSGVGADLLRRVIAAFPQAKERIPDLRMIVVAGPASTPSRSPPTPASKWSPTFTTSTGTWPPATWRSCRAA